MSQALPGPPSRHDVFISYAGPDREIAAAISSGLEAAGVGVWWDGLLQDGEPFERQIQHALTQVRIVVAILSPQTLASEWVRWELTQASRNGLHIVLLLAGGIGPGDLPPPLHLLPVLRSSAAGDGGLGQAAVEIGLRLQRVARSRAEARETDARRRLASAAARTAREAEGIKQRRARQDAPPIIIDGAGPTDRSLPTCAGVRTSEGFADFLRDAGIAVAFSSFQTDELYLLGHAPGGQLVVDVQHYRRPTGLCARDGSLLVGTLAHLYRLENILGSGQRMDGVYTHCFVPRSGCLTGAVDTHDVALAADGRALFVATRYNCVATPSRVHSFRALWRPPFVTALVAEDRCHLNGLALRDGAPVYATATAATDECEGWREQTSQSGVVIDMRSDTVVCERLWQPHSPRWHDGRLWLLNSGRGELGWLEPTGSIASRFRVLAELPGFARGLALHGHHAFVGLSRPRYEGLTAGADLGRAFADPWCGVQVVDLRSGERAHWVRLDGAVREIYDVAVLQGVACARSVSPTGDDGIDLVTVELDTADPRAS